jgi:SlyX protein
MTNRDARLAELEIAFAHQERLSEEPSEVVSDHAKRLDMMERRLAALLDRLTALEAGDPAAPATDLRPPHW